MKNLREIVQILTSGGQKKISLLGIEPLDSDSNTYYSRLFDGICEGRFRSDEDAARELYASHPSDLRYTTLKSRFKDIMFQALLNMDVKQPKVSPVLEANHKCNKQLVCAKLLIAFGARSSGIALIRKILTKARQFDFTDIAVQCALMARRHYGTIGNKSEFAYFDELVDTALEIQRAEARAEKLNYEILMEFTFSSAFKPELHQMAEDFAMEIDSYRKRFATYNLNLVYYRVKLLSKQIAMDYGQTLKVCEEFEHYVESHPQFDTPSVRRETSILRMGCYTFLRNYTAGQQYADQWLTLFQPGKQNWFAFLEFYFLLSMHTANYDKASEIFHTVVRHRRFEYAPPQRVERWKVFEAYLRYIGNEQLDEKLSPRTSTFGKSFRLFKFLNEVPIFSKDKSGYNVPVLIVHILFLLEEGRFDYIVDRAEPLRLYTSRYLRKEGYHRTNCFLKMIRIMIDKDFDYEQTESRTRSYLKKLLEPSGESRHWLEVTEIIPFEVLWKRVLLRLQRKL